MELIMKLEDVKEANKEKERERKECIVTMMGLLELLTVSIILDEIFS